MQVGYVYVEDYGVVWNLMLIEKFLCDSVVELCWEGYLYFLVIDCVYVIYFFRIYYYNIRNSLVFGRKNIIQLDSNSYLDYLKLFSLFYIRKISFL